MVYRIHVAVQNTNEYDVGTAQLGDGTALEELKVRPTKGGGAEDGHRRCLTGDIVGSGLVVVGSVRHAETAGSSGGRGR